MAFPVVQTRATGINSTNSSSHSITLPAGIVAGDLILVLFSFDSNLTASTTSTGWVKLGQASNGIEASGAVFYKSATGSDALTVTTSGVEQNTHISLRISGASGVVTGTSSNGSSISWNAPSHTPPGGAQDYLWVVTRSGDSTVVAPSPPTNYNNLQTRAATSASNASSNTAERLLNAASEDPATVTMTSEQWVAWTLAIAPAAAAAAAFVYRRSRGPNYRR